MTKPIESGKAPPSKLRSRELNKFFWGNDPPRKAQASVASFDSFVAGATTRRENYSTCRQILHLKPREGCQSLSEHRLGAKSGKRVAAKYAFAEQPQPQLFLRLHCGCHFKLENMDEVIQHFENYPRHIVTITGSLTLQRVDNPSSKPSISYSEFSKQGLSCSIAMACGDGFHTEQPTKATEHVLKSGHKLRVFGTLRKLKSNHKKRDSGANPKIDGSLPPPRRSPHPSKPLMAVGVVKGIRTVNTEVHQNEQNPIVRLLTGARAWHPHRQKRLH